MTVGSYCSGIGGFDLAAEECGFTVKYVSEIEKYPCEVLKARFPNSPNIGDFTKVNGGNAPTLADLCYFDCLYNDYFTKYIDCPVDIVVGGTPCQSFSMAGKREGFDGASGIFVDWIARLKEMKPPPKYTVWENVPGVFAGVENFRRVLELFLRICDEKVNVPKPKKWEKFGVVIGEGYSLAWRVLNAAEMGVPQQRKRVYLVLCTRSERAAEILAEREGVCRNFTPCYLERKKATLNTVGSAEATIGFNGHKSITGSICAKEEISPCLETKMPPNVLSVENHSNAGRLKIRKDGTVQTLSARMGTGGNNEPFVLEPSGFDGAGVYEKTTPTLAARQYKDPPCFCIQATTVDRKPQNGAAGKGVKTGESYTLNTVDRHVVAYDPYNSRVTWDKFHMLTTGSDYHKTGAVAFGNTSHGGYTKGTTPLRASGGDYGGGSENIVVKDYVIRRITPLECLRLQGFPDDHFDGVPGSDTAKYKACGNSLAVPCALFVLRGIHEVENSAPPNEKSN